MTNSIFSKLADNFHVTPEVGKLLLFPGWLQHGVSTNTTSSNRKSLAFNIYFNKINIIFYKLVMKNLYLLFLIFSLGSAFADPSPPANRDPQWLTESRVSIKSGKYEKAIQILENANQTNSAKWNNLRGYSLRQKQPPDLSGAQKYYEAALSIGSSHKGTLEYYRMLKLINDGLPGAEILLIRLNKACFFGAKSIST